MGGGEDVSKLVDFCLVQLDESLLLTEVAVAVVTSEVSAPE